MTRLFLTRIPFFKDVLVSSFTCDNCGLHNTELQPGGKIQEKGVKFVCTINTVKVSMNSGGMIEVGKGEGVKFVCTINIIKEVRVRNGVYVKYVCTINTIKVDKDVPSSITRAELNVHFKLV